MYIPIYQMQYLLAWQYQLLRVLLSRIPSSVALGRAGVFLVIEIAHKMTLAQLNSSQGIREQAYKGAGAFLMKVDVRAIDDVWDHLIQSSQSLLCL